jgi:SAM-dependent methyltransferase
MNGEIPELRNERSSFSEIHDREIGFHDNWAKAVNPEDVPVLQLFESPVAVENRYIIRQMGNLARKRILDIGCGLGESSVYFALRGADVTSMDISSEMVDLTQRLAQFHGVRVRGIVGTADRMELDTEPFDFVYAANLIHHLPNHRAFFAGAAKLLKIGGVFFSWDPLAYNPIIKTYRRMATEVRSEDERPLTFRDIQAVESYFSEVHHREFWILTLSIFLKYYFIDRVHPNQDRYWKRIFRESPRSLWWWYPALLTDSVLTRLPLVKRLAWNTVIVAKK